MVSHEKPAVLLLLLLTAIFYLNFFSRVIFSPLLPSIEDNLSLTHSKAGTIFLILSCGYFISLIGSGFVSSKLGHQKTIVVSMFFISASLLLISFSNSLPYLQTAFFLLGLGAGIYLPSAIATISEIFAPADWGKAFSVHEIAPNLAFLTAPLGSSLLLAFLHWQHIVLILAIATFVAGILYNVFGKGRENYGTPPKISLCLTILKQRNFQLLILLFSLGISSTIGIFNILPLFLVTNHALPLQDANLMVGLSRILPLATALIGGWLADRFGNKKTIALVLLLSGLTTSAIGFTSGIFLLTIIFLQALLAVCFFPAGFSLLSQLTGSSARNVVISLSIPLSFLIGGGLLPSMIMVMADAGNFNAGIIMAGLCISSGSFFVILTRNEKSGCFLD